LADTPPPESQAVEPVGPSLYLGAIGASRSAWIGPAWAALCGLIASAAFSLNGQNLLSAAFVLIVADWAWPALWMACVRTDWLAAIARWPDTLPPERSLQLPYLQPGSPGDRLLRWAMRVAAWRRSFFAPLAGSGCSSALVALVISLSLSAALGWRALALSLAVIAITGMGTLRAARTAIDSDGLRSIVYGALAWWLGHAAFAPLTVPSAAMGVLFGLAYRARMGAAGDERAPLTLDATSRGAPAGLIAPQVVAAIALFASGHPAAAFVAALAIGAQAGLRTFLAGHTFARQSQAWLAATMLVCAIAIV
jgi:hypothetical protein